MPLESDSSRTTAAQSASLMELKFLASSALSFLANPKNACWMTLQTVGQVAAWFRAQRPQGSPAAPAVFRLPFAGIWRIHRGGVTPQSSHSWHIFSQRYAYDFCGAPTGPQESSCPDRRAGGANSRDSPAPRQGPEARLESYPCFGRPILAAEAGTVVARRDGVRDYPRPGTGWIDWRSPDPRGNFILLRHGDALYSLSAHLRQGSLLVNIGERVQAGQKLAECGNSGHSTEPHLHFQAQDRPDTAFALGVPIFFEDARRVGGEDRLPNESPPLFRGFICGGQQVTSDPQARTLAQAPQLTPARLRGRDLVASLFMLAAFTGGMIGLIRLTLLAGRLVLN